jgi:hypothetical protein
MGYDDFFLVDSDLLRTKEGTENLITLILQAISRRATLHEMVRDYEQAACDLRSLMSILETQSNEKAKQSSSPSGSNGGKESRQVHQTFQWKIKAKGEPPWTSTSFCKYFIQLRISCLTFYLAYLKRLQEKKCTT